MIIKLAPRGYGRIDHYNIQTMRKYNDLLASGYPPIIAPVFVCVKCHKAVKMAQCVSKRGHNLLCLDCYNEK